MTFLGKLVLLLNLGLSLAFAGWALGIYMNHIPLASRTTEGGEKVVGKVDTLGSQIGQLRQVKDPAVARWQTSRDRLLRLEAQRPPLQKWYADQIDTILNKDNVAVLELIVQNGQLVTDDMMRQPVQIGGQAGVPAMTYLRKFKTIHMEIAQLQDEVTRLIKDEEALTREINDILRPQVAAEELTLKRQEEEVRSLVPEILLYQAEGQLFLKRRDALRARKAELMGLPPLNGD